MAVNFARLPEKHDAVKLLSSPWECISVFELDVIAPRLPLLHFGSDRYARRSSIWNAEKYTFCGTGWTPFLRIMPTRRIGAI
jgi:hypothetical protein